MPRKKKTAVGHTPVTEELTPPPEFQPSPLPSTMEHAMLAAQLLARSSGPTLQDREISKAVTAAAKMWGAVLAHKTERTVEEARLVHAIDRDRAEARWDQWHLQELGLAEQAAAWEHNQAHWRAREDKCFKNRSFPASADDVLLWIMGGSKLGRSKESRHAEFSKAWLESEEAATRSRLALKYGHPPGPGELLQRVFRLQNERLAKGKPPVTWPYEGPEGPAKLAAAVENARQRYNAQAEAALEKELGALKAKAAGLRTETWSRQDAALYFVIWAKYSSQQGRKMGGNTIKERAKKKQEAEKEAAEKQAGEKKT